MFIPRQRAIAITSKHGKTISLSYYNLYLRKLKGKLARKARVNTDASISDRSWLEWILQNQVSARRLELNIIIFRQIAPTLLDLVVFKEISIQRLTKGQDTNGYSKIWIKAYIEVSCFSRSFCKNLVRGANNVCLITVPRLPCKAYS